MRNEENALKDNPCVVDLGDEFEEVVVQGRGVRIELGSSGSIIVYTNGNVQVRPADSDDKGPEVAGDDDGRRKVGDRMPDDTIYAGISPDTGHDMFAAPQDVPGVMKWAEAVNYSADSNDYGHQDWRLPSDAELDVLYRNRHKGALRGTFNESGSACRGWYLSSTEHPGYAEGVWMERFHDGTRGWYWKYSTASVRLVLSEPAAPK